MLAPQPFRDQWVRMAAKIANPFLAALAQDRLRKDLPVFRPERHEFAPLEGLGRILSGIAPWLERNEPKARELRKLAIAALKVGADPSAEDHFRFRPAGALTDHRPYQGLVDAAHLALAFRRSPSLWLELDAQTRDRLTEGFLQTQTHRSHDSNWVLFGALIEAFLSGVSPDRWVPERVDRALRDCTNWYLGDGFYGDGPGYRANYYNSFALHPFLLEIQEALGGLDAEWDRLLEPVLARAQRHAEWIERLISPEGTYPVFGRSAVYRFGVFHLPAMLAWKQQLSPKLPPAQLGAAMHAVLGRFSQSAPLFDQHGWLTVGFLNEDPKLAEGYISRASLYAFCWGFLPLGLPESHPFWSNPNAEWTQRRAWSGQSIPLEGALERRNW